MRTFVRLLVVLAAILTLSAASMAGAIEPVERHRFEVRFSQVEEDKSLGAGYNVGGNWWAMINLDHLGRTGGPSVGVTGLYRVPKKLLFLDIYGGPGIKVPDSDSDPVAHVTAGASFWFLFWETEYQLDSAGESFYRSGFRVTF